MKDGILPLGDLGGEERRPLAERVRPARLEDVLGQEALLGEGGPLSAMVRAGALRSMILWGPAGSGKTTIARLLARACGAPFEEISAIFSTVSDLRKLFDRARSVPSSGRHPTGRHPTMVLFVDEIHRFNRTQQDSFLPILEEGALVLIGATTENPSFCLQSALLSRAMVLPVLALTPPDLERLLERVEAHVGTPFPADGEARKAMVGLCQGDGRVLVGYMEQVYAAVASSGSKDLVFSTPDLLALLKRRAPVYDRAGDGHYTLISALHKTIRGSDPDAALYYLARMLKAGEDPFFITRRLIRLASEDIGMSDPDALAQALCAQEAYRCLGSPEGELAIAQAVVYLACAPKSNRVYDAFKKAQKDAEKTGNLSPPQVILNAPSSVMADLGYGKGYRYDHDEPEGFSGQAYFPEKMGPRVYYTPVERGFEREIKKRLAYWNKLRTQKNA